MSTASLPADRRAAVEQWLGSHADDAARVAAWRAQAEAIRARYGAVAGEPVPPRFDLDALARAGPQMAAPCGRGRAARVPCRRRRAAGSAAALGKARARRAW